MAPRPSRVGANPSRKNISIRGCANEWGHAVYVSPSAKDVNAPRPSPLLRQQRETGGIQGKTGEQTGEQLAIFSGKNGVLHRVIAAQLESLLSNRSDFLRVIHCATPGPN